MRCYLDDTQYKCIKIEDDVTISYGVYFACHGEKQTPHKLIIRKGAYIGMHSNFVVNKDIEIGEGAIIGAGSLVNKSIPAGKTAAGVPVRLLDWLSVDFEGFEKAIKELLWNHINVY